MAIDVSRTILAFTILLSVSESCTAQSPAPVVPLNQPPATAVLPPIHENLQPPATPVTLAAPTEPPPNPFAGDLFTRLKLTGDWFGARSALADRGVGVNVFNTNFYNGVARGGRDQGFEFGGRLDYLLNVDGEKLGLWKGLFVNMHAETRYGRDVNALDGLLAPSNAAMNFPDGNRDVSAITGLKVTQAVSENLAFYFGKINGLDDAALKFDPGNRGLLPLLGGFQAMGLVNNLIAARTVPYSFAGAGVAVLVDRKPVFTLTVLDPQDRAVRGMDNLFDRGVTLVPDVTLRGAPLGLPAVLNVGGTYSNARYRALDPATYFNLLRLGELRATLVGGGPVETGSWSVHMNGYHALWADPCDRERNWGLFGSWGVSDGNPNPLRHVFAAGVGGRSMLPGRHLDNFGIGWYYLGLSDEVKRLTQRAIPLRDEYGVELFYNIAVTPWCRLTPNFQVAQPAQVRNDTAIITGLRLQLVF